MKKFKILLFLFAGLFSTSCEFGDTNIDPTRPADVPLNLILPTAEAQTAYNIAALAGRMPGILVQHFAGFDAQQLGYTNYVIDENDMNNLWVGGLYGGAMKDCQVMFEKASEQNQPYYAGIAKILMAHNLGIATQFFGDVPYSEAFKGVANLKPAFDTQESIYNAIQRLLDESIADLSKPAVSGGPAANSDLIFGGNAANWIATAQSLKARYFLHLSKKDNSAYSKALTAVSGAIKSTATQPNFKFANTQTGANPYYLFAVGRPNTMIIAPSFAKLMDDKADPRKDKIMFFDGAKYVFYQAGNSNLYWSQINTAIPLISYTETKFIEAEAKLMTGDESGAAAALLAAIQANMTQLGVDGTAYIQKYGNFTGLGSQAEKLERIISEKYTALYGQAVAEVWTDYRRTGLPKLTPSAQGVNGNNPSGIIPRRFIYPISERSFNLTNLETAIKRQGRGTGLLDDTLWAY